MVEVLESRPRPVLGSNAFRREYALPAEPLKGGEGRHVAQFLWVRVSGIFVCDTDDAGDMEMHKMDGYM